MGGAVPLPESSGLRKDSEEIAPSEASCSAFNHIMVVAAAPSFRAGTSAFQCGIKYRLSKCAHCFTAGAVLLHVNKVAYAITHLAFCFLDEQGFGGSHQSRASLDGDSFDVTSDESVVGSGGDDCVQHDGIL